MYEVSTATHATNVKTTSAQRRSESHPCEVAPIRKMVRKATKELKSAELNNKVQTVKKSLEERQHIDKKRYSKQFNSFRPGKKPGRLQRRTRWNPKAEKSRLRQTAKEVAEREGKARQRTKQMAGAKATAEADNVSRRTVSFRNEGRRQYAE